MEKIDFIKPKYKKGNIVEIIDNGETFDTNSSFFDNENAQYIGKWQKYKIPENGSIAQIIESKVMVTEDIIYLIEIEDKYYLIGENGLEFISNGIQTNGIQTNRQWLESLSDEDFAQGILDWLQAEHKE